MVLYQKLLWFKFLIYFFQTEYTPLEESLMKINEELFIVLLRIKFIWRVEMYNVHLLEVKLNTFKETVSIISNGPPCKDGNVLITRCPKNHVYSDLNRVYFWEFIRYKQGMQELTQYHDWSIIKQTRERVTLPLSEYRI